MDSCGATIQYNDEPVITCMLLVGHKGAHCCRIGRTGITWCTPKYFAPLAEG